MAAARSVITLLLVLAAAPAAHGASAPGDTASADSSRAAPRVVRRFPPIEVRASLRDRRSSQTVRSIPGTTLQDLPVDGLVEAVGLQAGVVTQAGELHVRGGRAGETTEYLDGFCVSEPLRRRMLELPLFALREVELVTGAPEAQYGCGLAGALQLVSVDPGPRWSADARWTTDFGLSDHYDRANARVNVPLGGLGVVAAGDATLDGTWYPALRTPTTFDVAGLTVARRSEDLLQAWLKLAPVRSPRRFAAQVLTSRRIHQPYDAAWTTEQWSTTTGQLLYRAADHLPITEDRQLGALLSTAAEGRDERASATLGWMRTRSVSSVSGVREDLARPYSVGYESDPFQVAAGDYPLYRESDSDALALRGDLERSAPGGDSRVAAGAGLTYEDARLREMDWAVPTAFGVPILDRFRSYDAHAPGGYGYAQGRWTSGGLVVNGGLRCEYWTPGAAGRSQTLPWDGRGALMVSPRLGVAYPVSRTDAFSFSYAHVSQPPARDFLYDQRQAISNRQPLGNPALKPETVVSYESAYQRVFGVEWAMQASVFYRELYDQVGARDYAGKGLPLELRYDNAGNGNVIGFEWNLAWSGERARAEAHYTWMNARGYESRPEGEPFGAIRSARAPVLGDAPLSWDRRHSVVVSASLPWRRSWEVSWSTQVGSPLPWTPHGLTDTIPDPSLINSARLTWSECTNASLRWKPLRTRSLVVACEVRNLFDTRGENAATLDGYPNPLINTRWDEYGAYRTATGQGGGGYWTDTGGGTGHWVPVNDPRLYDPPRSVRMSFSGRW